MTELIGFISIPFFYASLLGAYVLFLDKQRNTKHIKQSVLIFLFSLPVLFIFLINKNPSPALLLALISWLLFLNALCILLINFYNDYIRWRDHLAFLFKFLLIPVLAIVSQYFLLNFFHQHLTQDPLLFAFDATLGFDPSFILGQVYLKLPYLIQLLLCVIYATITLALAITCTTIDATDNSTRNKLLIEFIFLGIVGYGLYRIIPACGTSGFFGSAYPLHPPTPLLNPNVFSEPAFVGILPNNCVPSLHTAWILCLWRYLWQSKPRWRWIISTWAALGLFATIVVGQHYVVDVVVGFAFALTIQSLFTDNIPWSQPIRVFSFLSGLILCSSWFLLIKFGIDLMRITPQIPRFLYAFSLFFSSFMIYRLMNSKVTASQMTTLASRKTLVSS